MPEGKTSWPIAKPTAKSLAPDGKVLGVNDAESGLIIFSRDGKKLWNVKDSYRFFKLSNSAQQIIGSNASRIKQIALLSEGKTLDSLSLKNPVYNVTISPNGKFIMVTDTRTIKYFENRLDQKSWEYTFDNEQLTINSTAVSNNGYVACGLIKDNGKNLPSEKRFTECNGYIFDNSGKIIWQIQYKISRSNAWIPIVSLTPVNEKQTVLTVRTREKLFLYTIDL